MGHILDEIQDSVEWSDAVWEVVHAKVMVLCKMPVESIVSDKGTLMKLGT